MPHHSIFLEGVAYILGKSQLHMPVLDFPWLENGDFNKKVFKAGIEKIENSILYAAICAQIISVA